ncbi:hypothetical protein FLAG1_08532 [Fusarium langsethiae]|uniref:Uncharacterized protein n=1 Tax=Fusarium langsethiae TaxID=179993 RepID=A0A0M9ERV7_FUSLA|nr:hypothetical protein FLAG1_08532 [Fusarium langsethiae]
MEQQHSKSSNVRFQIITYFFMKAVNHGIRWYAEHSRRPRILKNSCYLYRILAAEFPNRTMASSTKCIGEDAENGINERIMGYHTFVIQKPSTIIADGLLVGVTRYGQLDEEMTEKSTGSAGWDVETGDRVRVFNVNVLVKPR